MPKKQYLAKAKLLKYSMLLPPKGERGYKNATKMFHDLWSKKRQKSITAKVVAPTYSAIVTTIHLKANY